MGRRAPPLPLKILKLATLLLQTGLEGERGRAGVPTASLPPSPPTPGVGEDPPPGDRCRGAGFPEGGTPTHGPPRHPSSYPANCLRQRRQERTGRAMGSSP